MSLPQSFTRITLPVIMLTVFGLAHNALAQGHVYNLATTGYADQNGGPSLTPNGGTLSSSGYTFGADQGPTLTGGLTSLSTYTIEFTVSLDANNGNRGNGYQKLIDFNGLNSDAGLYDLSGRLVFFNDIFPSNTVFTPGQATDVLLTRDGTTNLVTGYANGVQQFQFADTNNDAIFAANSIRFFQDDNATSNGESGSGVLTSVYINASPTAAPEPSQFAALAVGLLGLGALAIKSRRRLAK